MTLGELALRAAQGPHAHSTAVDDGTDAITYQELDQGAARLAHLLWDLGVRPGDRVGLWLEKSTRAVVAMQAALRAGALYVPVDPLSPRGRALTILQDCEVRCVVTTANRAPILQQDMPGVSCVTTDGRSGDAADWSDLEALPVTPLDVQPRGEDDPAYILYTSGSTGRPKGVCITHRNALAFIEWAVRTLEAAPQDRFSNHAPFHFDLSVLDLYCAFSVGASVLIVPETAAYIGHSLVEFVKSQRPTIWYSVPSALILMMDEGGLLELDSLPTRAILFAGEPFPVKHLRRLYQRWPDVRLLNLYGPTETNVCTYYEVEHVADDRTRPVPIGRGCSGDQVWAVDDDGRTIGPGETGELMVRGPTVMRGYWGQPPQGDRPYATGDLVRLLDDGNYEYVGRRDHMVKVRGYRVELGEIEAALLAHPAFDEVAVLVESAGVHARLIAFATLATPSGKPGLLEVKRHCAARLPRYMIVDRVHWMERLPRTRNGKIDRKELARMLESKDSEGGRR